MNTFQQLEQITHDVRLQGRRGCTTPEEHKKHLAQLPDVALKAAPQEDADGGMTLWVEAQE